MLTKSRTRRKAKKRLFGIDSTSPAQETSLETNRCTPCQASPTGRHTTDTKGFDFRALTFSPKNLLKTYTKAGILLYNETYLKIMKIILNVAKQFPTFNDILTEQNEWDIEQADKVVNTVYAELDNLKQQDFEFRDAHHTSVYYNHKEYEYCAVKINDCGLFTGSIFISDYLQIKDLTDKRIALQGLKLLTEMNFGFWHQTENWDTLSQISRDDSELYKELNLPSGHMDDLLSMFLISIR